MLKKEAVSVVKGTKNYEAEINILWNFAFERPLCLCGKLTARNGNILEMTHSLFIKKGGERFRKLERDKGLDIKNNPNDSATGQPLRCIALTGQRMGEMENWSLLSHGAFDVLMELRRTQMLLNFLASKFPAH